MRIPLIIYLACALLVMLGAVALLAYVAIDAAI